MNFSCKLSVYIYICFLCMKIENKFYSILFYSIPAVSETLVLNETKPTKRSQITDQNLRKEANAKCAVSVNAKRVSNS